MQYAHDSTFFKKTYIEAHPNTESSNLLFQFPKFRLARVLHIPFTTQGYAQGPKWKKLMIHWNEDQEKATSIGLQFHRPKLSDESCFTHFFNYGGLCKERSMKHETGNTHLSTQSTSKENHGNTKKVNF